MNWRALTIAFCTAAASVAQAETIVARSGEHDGFTRLVMRLPEGVDWSLTQNGKSGVLNINSPDVVYDTSKVFGRIPRTRLASLSQTGPGQPLKFELACECELRSHVMDNGYLVVDVRDQKPGQQSPVVETARVAEPVEGTSYTPTSGVLPLIPTVPLSNGYRFSLSDSDVIASRMATNLQSALTTEDTLVRPTQHMPKPQAAEPAMVKPADPAMDLHRAGDAAMPTEMAPAETMHANNLQDNAELLSMAETKRTAAVRESERRLLQQIGRASNQGLLDLLVSEVQDGNGSRMVSPLGREDRPMNPLDHLSVTTAVDRESGLFTRPVEEDKSQQLCFADVEVAVHTWGSDAHFSTQISELRRDLVKEFDKFDQDKLVELAKAYLFFGFGAEARATLDLLSDGAGRPDNLVVLETMADILDDLPVPINNVFEGQQQCQGHSSLWAALADGEIKSNADTDAIQQAYAMMPSHLRVHLGPKISTLFSHLGEKHIAEATLRTVERAGVENVPDINLAEAALAELDGDMETVAQELAEEVAQGSENTPRALIDLIDLHYKERRALTPDVPELVGSYEVENRDTAIGRDLRRAEVVALALETRFEEAFQEIERVKKHDGESAKAAALEPLFALLTERASDVTFLRYGLTFSEEATSAEAAPVADAMARRLLDLGFAEHARSLLQKNALGEPSEDRKVALAEVAIALNDPSEALNHLSGLETSDANRLRAQAHWLEGDYDQASQVLLEEQATEEAARGFWLSENYQAISGIEGAEGARFGAVASVTTEIDRAAQDPLGMPPLAEARALMETSQGTRDQIEQLLAKVGVSEDE